MTTNVALKSLGKLMMGTMVALPIIATLNLPMAIAEEEEGGDLEFEIINKTSERSIVDFRVSPTASDQWGENLLYDVEEVNPDDTLKVTIQDGLLTCKYDTRTGWSDGTENIETNVDMCDKPSWEYED